jgi:hypothetical protein
MKKITKIISCLSVTLFLSILVFSLSSKGPGNYTGPQQPPCEDNIGEGLTRKLRIQFNESTNPNPFRKEPSYIGYIPSPDIRNGDFPGAETSGAITAIAEEVNNYYASVTITSPQCDDWEWKRVFDASNGNNNGEMEVQVPGDYSMRVIIKYYERLDNSFFGNAPDFNIDVNNFSCGMASSTRVLYSFDEVFLSAWGGTQPMTMIPTSNDPLTCLDISAKYSTMADYNSTNEFIDINNLNPK